MVAGYFGKYSNYWGKSLSVLLCSLLLMTACNAQSELEVETEEALPTVEVATVEKGVLERGVQLSGVVKGETEVDVVPKLSGKIERVLVSVGDVVNKGDLLVQLDESDIRSQVAQAEAAVKAAQAGLQAAKEQAQSLVINSDNAYEQAKRGVEQAQQQLETARTAYENTKTDYERMNQLFQAGLISQQQFEQTKLGLEQAKAALKQAESAYESAKEGLKLARNNQLQAQKQTSVKTAQANLQQAQAGLQAARQQLSNARVTAPVSGKVASVTAVEGAMASMGMPLLKIVDMDPAIVEVKLPENVYPQVQVGQEVNVEVQGTTVVGKVRSKDMAPDPATRTYLMKVEVPNADERLASGLTAKVLIPEQGTKETLLIPVAAYMESAEAGRGRVMVYKNGVVEERTVEVGRMTSEKVEILSGLVAGEQVVVRGQHLLKDGDRVELASSAAGRTSSGSSSDAKKPEAAPEAQDKKE